MVAFYNKRANSHNCCFVCLTFVILNLLAYTLKRNIEAIGYWWNSVLSLITRTLTFLCITLRHTYSGDWKSDEIECVFIKFDVVGILRSYIATKRKNIKCVNYWFIFHHILTKYTEMYVRNRGFLISHLSKECDVALYVFQLFVLTHRPVLASCYTTLNLGPSCCAWQSIMNMKIHPYSAPTPLP